MSGVSYQKYMEWQRNQVLPDTPMKSKTVSEPTVAMVTQVLCWKYVYHLSANRIKKMLRNQGIYISKASLNRYMQNGMRLLREYLEEPFKLEVQTTDYLMTDETTELVGVVEDGVKSYKKRYLWAFFAKMKKAVTYTLNQWKSLENFIKDGRVEISNNLCEQRMKAVKLNLKNCQNIGSEFAAENAAFMFSVTESCSLNGINPESYLEDVFRSILFGTKRDRRDFLPCYYQTRELPKMNALEVAKLLSTAA